MKEARPRLVFPEANKANPGRPMDFKEGRASMCRWSRIEAGKLERAELLTDTPKPGCSESRTSIKAPKHALPYSGKAVPGHAKLRAGKSASNAVSSETGVKKPGFPTPKAEGVDPKRPKLCIDKVGSKLAKSGINRGSPNLEPPKTEEAKPGLADDRRDDGNPRDKESKAGAAGSDLARP